MVRFWKGQAKNKDLSFNYKKKDDAQPVTWFKINNFLIYLALSVIVISFLIPGVNGILDIYPYDSGFQGGDNLLSDLSFYSGTEYYLAEYNFLLNSNYDSYAKGPDYSVSSGEGAVLTITVTQDEIMLSFFFYLILLFLMPVTILISFLAVIFNPGKRGYFYD